MLITRRQLAGAAAGATVAPRGPQPPDVIVLGAGVSGLQVAWLLEQQGARVLVLEGRRRVGGRVYTLMDQPGTPELGFNAMGAGYGRGIDAAHRAGVTLYDAGPRMMQAARMELVLGGKVIASKQWPGAAANPFPAAQRMLMPWQIVPAVIARHNPLQNWADWLKPQNAALDVAMGRFLQQQGLSEAAIRLGFDTAPYYGTTAADVSALMFEFNAGWGKTQAAAGPAMLAVTGGNQKLTEGMARLLHGPVLLGKTVTAISRHSGGATVRCRDGTGFTARHVVSSLPFSTLRRVAIDPPLHGGQAEAVRSLPYQPISIAFLTVSSAFWERDGLAPSMWTDGPLGTVLAQYFAPDPHTVSGFMVQARGALAHHWDRLGRDATLAMLVAQIEAIRPASRGTLRGVALQSWTLDPFNAGDWAYFAPGQISRFVAGMAAPAGCLHFCGEHTATANRGLEGALESADRVAVEILSA